MSLFWGIINRDVKLATKKGGGVFNMLIFYFMASVLFVFGIGSDLQNAKIVAPAVIWVCALLVQSIFAERIFTDDYEDGTLEQLFLQGELPEKIVLARIISNWLTGGLIITIFSPVIALLFGLGSSLIAMLIISLLVGTPLLSIISVKVAALTIGIKKSGVIFGMLAFPLYVPVLIFGASWTVATETFFDNMSLLFAIFLFMLPVCVAASSSAIRASFSD